MTPNLIFKVEIKEKEVKNIINLRSRFVSGFSIEHYHLSVIYVFAKQRFFCRATLLFRSIKT